MLQSNCWFCIKRNIIKKFPVTFKLNIPNKPSSSITSLIFQEYLSDSYAQNSPFVF